jgi:hypothetical protein
VAPRRSGPRALPPARSIQRPMLALVFTRIVSPLPARFEGRLQASIRLSIDNQQV